MNIVFFGSSHFSAPSLKALLDSRHTISCIVTQPDRKKGRGMHLGVTAIKEAASSSGIKLCQPEKANTTEFMAMVRNVAPDLFVVIAYGQILSKELLLIPKTFAVNVHASLLPQYRGAAPINWALINGERYTGITVIKMNEKMDAGPVILKQRLEIADNDTWVSLENRLADKAAALLLESIQGIETGRFTLTPQDTASVSLAPKLKKETGLIDWTKSSRAIYNLVRGTLPWPGAYTYYRGKFLKIHAVSDSGDCPSQCRPAEIIGVSREGILAATGRGCVNILELQPAGKRVMKASEFISGHAVKPGERFG